jgi:hypothetical protein
VACKGRPVGVLWSGWQGIHGLAASRADALCGARLGTGAVPNTWVRERWAADKQAVAADGLKVKQAGLTCLAHLGKENIFLFLFNIFPKAQKSH